MKEKHLPVVSQLGLNAPSHNSPPTESCMSLPTVLVSRQQITDGLRMSMPSTSILAEPQVAMNTGQQQITMPTNRPTPKHHHQCPFSHHSWSQLSHLTSRKQMSKQNAKTPAVMLHLSQAFVFWITPVQPYDLPTALEPNGRYGRRGRDLKD